MTLLYIMLLLVVSYYYPWLFATVAYKHCCCTQATSKAGPLSLVSQVTLGRFECAVVEVAWVGGTYQLNGMRHSSMASTQEILRCDDIRVHSSKLHDRKGSWCKFETAAACKRNQVDESVGSIATSLGRSIGSVKSHLYNKLKCPQATRKARSSMQWRGKVQKALAEQGRGTSAQVRG